MHLFSALGVHVCYLGHLGGYCENSDWVPFEQETPGKDTGHVGYALITWDAECALFVRLTQHLFYLAASVFYFSMAFCSKERKGQKKKTNAQLLMKHSQVERTCMISFKKMSIPTHLNKKKTI